MMKINEDRLFYAVISALMIGVAIVLVPMLYQTLFGDDMGVQKVVNGKSGNLSVLNHEGHQYLILSAPYRMGMCHSESCTNSEHFRKE